jgi:hypothetical protein
LLCGRCAAGASRAGAAVLTLLGSSPAQTLIHALLHAEAEPVGRHVGSPLKRLKDGAGARNHRRSARGPRADAFARSQGKLNGSNSINNNNNNNNNNNKPL